jgi:poly-gamma-glutamate synthesis protein (capsule biosynthesis protein)
MSSRSITIAAVGDIGLYKNVPAAVERHGVEAFCGGAASVLASADLRFANVEIPLVREMPSEDDFALAGPAEAATVLEHLSIDVACLANNHVMDAGWQGARETRETLEGLGIRTFGVGADLAEARAPLVVERAGLRVGFLGYGEGVHGKHRHTASEASPGVAPIDREAILSDVAALRSRVDVLVVSLHWGVNYVAFAMPEQRELARALFEAGVDLILGHHPHVPQGIEKIGRGLVAYSLGDFIFDWGGGNVTNEAALAQRRRTGILQLAWHEGAWEHGWTPVHQDDDHRPIVVSGSEAESHAEALRRLDEYYREGGYPDDPWGEAGKTIGNHASRVMLYHLKRGNLGYLAKKIFRIRPRHVKMIFGFLGRSGSGSPKSTESR